MITAGVDCGAKTVKVVVLDDGRVRARAMTLAGTDPRAAADQACATALDQAGLKKEDVGFVVATGAGRNEAPFASHHVTELTADARGAVFLFPGARTVIDVGAEEARGIRTNERGKVVDFASNEKCAAGTGLFVEAMARALEVKLEELGPLALKSQKAIPINAQCAVFAESEVVSLVHAKTGKEDIAKSVLDAIASRVVSMVSRVGIEKEIVLVGGMARNVGFVAALKKGFGMEITMDPDPEFVGALGAALIAAEQGTKAR